MSAPSLQLYLPKGWRCLGPLPTGEVFRYRDGLQVVMSLEHHPGSGDWIHVSCSYPDHLPSWSDLRAVKDIFIGEEREAYQVLPPAAEYVNVHNFCLHLWARPDGSRVVPRFA